MLENLAVGGLLLVFLNEQMRAWADLRLFAYFVVLVVLLRFSPEGLLAPAARGLARLLRGRRER